MRLCVQTKLTSRWVCILSVLIYRRGNHGYVNWTADMILPYACRVPKGSREEAPMKRLNIVVMILSACGLAGLAVSTASADIYAWTDENGVKYFTNQAPPKQATLFMKTPEIPHDEEADNQRREMDRMAVARQELAEREAFLLEQQQAAERRIAAANARADAALREADQILQDAQAASEDANYGYSNSYGYGYYYPYYGYGSRYHYKGYKRHHAGRYPQKRHYQHKINHYKYRKGLKPHAQPSHYNSRKGTHSLHRHSSAIRGRAQTHRSRVAAFRGRHGRF